MAACLPLICLLVSVTAIAADLSPERYWNTALPNTPIPNSLRHLFTPDFTDEKSTNVQVGKGGVNVNAGKGKPGGGTAVNVGKGGVHVDTGKGKGTHVSVSGGKGPGGGVGVHTGKPGKRTDVGVGKGGVIVHTRHKGKPVYVGVKPGPNPFVYNYAASKTQLHDDPKAALFFLEKDMVPGKEMNLRFSAEDGYDGKTAFLPRGEAETMPFESEKFSEILKTFSVKPGSGEAEMMKKTIEECEAKRVGGEEKYCATSLESMVDFSVSKLGKDHVRAVSTEISLWEGLLILLWALRGCDSGFGVILLYREKNHLDEPTTKEKLRSQDMAMKRNGKSPASSDSDESVMFFRDVSLGPHETRLRFRLIHFWEAQNPVKKTLIGLEMLLIDEQGTVIQGFIPPGRIKKYLPEMKRGSVYELINFYGSKNKPMYRVADHIATVSFAWNSELSVLHDIPIPFDEDRFRMHSYEDFEANCDLKGDLYDILGHMKLVDGQALTERPTIDEAKLATTRHIMVHVQSHEGPVMKLYLWDQAATDFCKKFKSYENTPTVLLVTSVNTKRLGGNLALSSMSPTRVFMDYDVQPTIDYFAWLSSNPEIAKQVSAEVVTKRETMTISDIFSYMTLESAKDAFFECTATIDDVVHGSAWYYIACTGCHSKATKGANSLICTNPRCVKDTTAGVAQYRAKISVYDSSEQGFFVLLGDAGFQLTGRHASELVSSYFEANKDKGPDHEVPVPEALISIIGQTHKFCVKVTDHNFSGNTRAITVTKILPPETPSPTKGSVDNAIAATSMEAVQTGSEVCGPSKSRGDSADEENKRTFDSVDPEKVKRARCEK